MRGLFAILLCIAACVETAAAHESRPLYVEIDEKVPGHYAVTWKIPPSALNVTSPVVRMPDTCEPSAPPAGSRLVKRQLFVCAGNISNGQIRVEFPGYNPSISTLFRFRRSSGEHHTTIQGPKEPVWTVPERETIASVGREYSVLGIQHILSGFDHLLFVACLVFISGTWRRVLVTVTGFTAAHSVTFSLASLNLVRLPAPPVEAAIALSIIFLAVEIMRDRRDTLTWRYPVAVSSVFGLLHGFGFATGLTEIGLPQTEIPAALLFFNLGVEAGQILFLCILVVATFLARTGISVAAGLQQREVPRLPAVTVRSAGYLIGSLAAFWLFQRLAGFAA